MSRTGGELPQWRQQPNLVNNPPRNNRDAAVPAIFREAVRHFYLLAGLSYEVAGSAAAGGLGRRHVFGARPVGAVAGNIRPQNFHEWWALLLPRRHG